eukprot:365725-Chlamydomonas_euryale.AAC.34
MRACRLWGEICLKPPSSVYGDGCGAGASPDADGLVIVPVFSKFCCPPVWHYAGQVPRECVGTQFQLCRELLPLAWHLEAPGLWRWW